MCIPLQHGHFPQTQLNVSLQRLQLQYPSARVLLGAGAEHLATYIEQSSCWRLCGNARIINQILDPEIFFTALESLEILYPDTLFQWSTLCQGWLTKTRHSCGGMGVMRDFPNPPESEQKQYYWQKQQVGQTVSALFIAQQGSCVRLGINLQYVEDSLSNMHPFIYSGLCANYKTKNKLSTKIDSYALNISKHFSYNGLFSMDMILAPEGLYVLEMNPRISASFEMYERLNSGLNLVDAHIRVCDLEQLPRLGPLSTQSRAYRIVFARQTLIIPEQVLWPWWVKDRPNAGRTIEVNEPLCSIHCDNHTLTSSELLHELQLRELELLALLKA